MDKTLLLTFIILNAINVIIQTVKSLCTIKGGKTLAAVVNAIAYGFYTIVVVYMVCDGLPLMWKVVIVGSCNFIGVWLVKFFEEKARKDKLWKVELTVPTQFLEEIDNIHIPHRYLELNNKHTVFCFYCATQKESARVKKIVDKYDAKYFASESKELY